MTQCRAELGWAGRRPRSQQWLGSRSPEVELFGGFFQNLYYYAETMGGQKWVFFKTCNALLRQCEGKSDDIEKALRPLPPTCAGAILLILCNFAYLRLLPGVSCFIARKNAPRGLQEGLGRANRAPGGAPKSLQGPPESP